MKILSNFHLNKILQSPLGTIINEEAFKTEQFELDWSFVTENKNINLGFETCLRFINNILDKHAPIKAVRKRKNKIISKARLEALKPQ